MIGYWLIEASPLTRAIFLIGGAVFIGWLTTKEIKHRKKCRGRAEP
ncbi:hypothetical protein [Paenibacillus senegalensis]|nr:hypothetical protein [Paenibacillus senegalensis]